MNKIIKPKSIWLDASTICQLNCPSCDTATGKVEREIGSRFLKFKDFSKLVDDNPWIRRIELSSHGEIFLNPDLLKIIKYAHKKNIFLTANNGVNLNKVDDNVLEALVKYNFHSFNCAIDGASQKTYSVYRRNGNFDNVIRNIKKINYYKNKYGSQYPLLNWQFVIFGHNEHEISVARKMAEGLKMTFKIKLNKLNDFSPIRNHEFVKRELSLEISSLAEYKMKFGDYYFRKTCFQLWSFPVINVDGRVFGCCNNYKSDFGNAFKEGLLNCLNNEKMNYARQMLLGKKRSRKDIPCTFCDLYKSLKETTWLTLEEEKSKSPIPFLIKKSFFARVSSFYFKYKRKLENVIKLINKEIGKAGIILKNNLPRVYKLLKPYFPDR